MPLPQHKQSIAGEMFFNKVSGRCVNRSLWLTLCNKIKSSAMSSEILLRIMVRNFFQGLLMKPGVIEIQNFKSPLKESNYTEGRCLFLSPKP